VRYEAALYPDGAVIIADHGSALRVVSA